MRIIAGAAKGRRLTGPKGSGTRPMTDRAREALFSMLGDRVAGARVLDLYAGTGSLGLEALSRGAAEAVFVERGRDALAALRANVAAVGLGGVVAAADVGAHLGRASGRFDLVFVDPPYADASVDDVLRAVLPVLERGATVVVHRRAGTAAPGAPGLVTAAERRYGDSVLWLLSYPDESIP